MSNRADTLELLFQQYGLSREETSIYIYLCQNSYSSVLKISRDLHIGRTKVYRLLDKLIDKELAQKKIDDMGMKFGPADPKKLEQLVNEREDSVKQLKEDLPELISTIYDLSKTSQYKSKILYYKGIEGYKQVTYNSTNAKGVLRIIEKVNDMSVILPKSFAEEMRRKFVENKIYSRQISPFPKSTAWTEVTEFVKKFSEARYLPPDKLKAEFEVLIYNDVYAIYNTEGEDAFCIEIYNPELASMQKQIFDFLWKSARKMKFADDHGSAEVV